MFDFEKFQSGYNLFPVLSFRTFTSSNRSLHVLRIYIFKIHTHLCFRNLTISKKTRRVLHMHARPEKGQLAEAASLRGASGKPSTWLPLGGHIQKDLLSSIFVYFGNLTSRSLCFLIVLRGGLLDKN